VKIPSEEESRKLSKEMSPILMGHAIACSAPITLEQTVSNGGSVSGGSCGFIKTPDRTFAVTAAHVIRSCIEILDQKMGRVLVGQCQVENFVDCVVDINDVLDIATFRVPEDALKYIRAKPGWEPRFSDYWPPQAPEVGTNVFFAGWPGKIRDDNEGGFVLRPLSANLLVSSMSEHRISICREHEHEIPSENTVPNNFDYGGLSGAPLFSLMVSNGLLIPCFVGVIIEAHNDYDLIQGVKGQYIKSDGTIQMPSV